MWCCGCSGRSALLGDICRAHRGVVDDSTTIELCRVLGEPVRFAIVKELRDGSRCACVLADVASVSPSLLSHHLKVLRDVGLIAGERRGRWIDYSLTSTARERLSHALLPREATA